jgi:hypothetical protein
MCRSSDPRGALLHVRQDGEGHAPGLGALAAMFVILRAAARGCASRSSSRQSGAPRASRRPGRERAPVRRQHGGEGDALRHLGLRPLRDDHDGASRAAPSTRCTTRSPRSAASSRCGSSSSARSSSAASGGLYGMLMFAVVAVFVAGLMVGRTPEYLGKKIEAYEMKMASLVVLVPRERPHLHGDRRRRPRRGEGISNPARTASARSSTRSRRPRTTTAARSAASPRTRPSTTRPSGSRCSSAASGSRSRCSRSRARSRKKKLVPAGAGTLPTHTPLFVAMLVGVVIIVGALTFIPALALGPIVEQLLAQS